MFALLAVACGDDDGGTPDSGSTPDGAVTSDAGAPDATPIDPVARGKYLVEHVAACGDCHTPRLMNGAPDTTKTLAGVTCFIDIDPGDPNAGCLNSRNLTNDATGLMNRSDAEIKEMFTNGVRPNGSFLNSFMPYWIFHNMTEADKDAVVAFLRTVPAVDNAIGANQPPFDMVPAAAVAIDMADVPMPAAGSATFDSAMRGRYLAATAACIDCHTPELPPGSARPIDMTKPFSGGRAFPAAAFGLPSPPFPAMIYTSNLTSDATGLAGYTVTDIKNELLLGTAKDGTGICPPMPAGPMAAFGGLTDEDATDIANYVLSLPPIANMIPNGCSAP